MIKIVWISDPHFQRAGRIEGLDPRMRLETALEYANAHYADADMLVISGDLAGHDPEDYAALQKVLYESKISVFPMMGIHDERAYLRDHLPLPKTTMPDFIQYAIETSVETVICLDMHKVGSHAGELCPTRLALLDETLGNTPN
ncbi:metallophosphoesterase [Planktotalea sp.]|uniref:metallophosphoesterase n=1 Tax=Planktotalea sp. TaxID=2029877 RepID=UPI0025EA5458|nr:metallophosphoesterase [Planktotalea sp.]